MGHLWKGNTCAPALSIEVRGHPVVMMNRKAPLVMTLGESNEHLTWLFHELYQDLKAQRKADTDGNSTVSDCDSTPAVPHEETQDSYQESDAVAAESLAGADETEEAGEAEAALIQQLKEKEEGLIWAESKSSYVGVWKGRRKYFRVSSKSASVREGMRVARERAREYSRGEA